MTRAVFLKPGSISLLVKKLLELGKEEQVFAGITPHQAVHLFAGKMVCLVDYVDRKLATCHYDPLKTYILSCDQVYPYLYLYLSIYIYIYLFYIDLYLFCLVTKSILILVLFAAMKFYSRIMTVYYSTIREVRCLGV